MEYLKTPSLVTYIYKWSNNNKYISQKGETYQPKIITIIINSIFHDKTRVNVLRYNKPVANK